MRIGAAGPPSWAPPARPAGEAGAGSRAGAADAGQTAAVPPAKSPGEQDAPAARASSAERDVIGGARIDDERSAGAAGGEPARGDEPAGGGGQARKPGQPAGRELSEADRAVIRELERRDAEVRAHESAHAAAAGAAGGGVHLEYTQGPDGRSYAVGGHVPVRLEAGRTPEETAANARRVRAAALAPAAPSSQDRAVAAQAAAMEAEALLAAATRRSEGSRDARAAGPSPGAAAEPEPSAEGAPPRAAEEGRAESADLVPFRLASERRAAFGERGHPHADSGCGPCGAAVRRYG